MRKLLCVICLLLLFNFPAIGFCEGLIVNGQDFAFSVAAPNNWNGDLKNASKRDANVIFYQKQLSAHSVVIGVRVNIKVDESIQEDLVYEMNEYKMQYPNIKFKDISVTHAKYQVFPKLLYNPDDFYEYITYINPGAAFDKMFSVSMNIQKREASEDEMRAYREVVGSLRFLNEKVAK